MQPKRILYLLALLALLVPLLSAPASAFNAGVSGSVPAGDEPTAETLREQALARAAELMPGAPMGMPAAFSGPATSHPLFVGVDDSSVPAYRIEPSNNNTIQAFVGAEVWGSAYDPVNNKVYFNSGSTLYEWPVGGSIAALGTVTDPSGAAQAMVGLAFYNNVLYGIKNIANEAIYAIDTTTRVATVVIDYADGDFDLGGFAADPNTGTFYATNDDTTPFGSGLFRMNPDGTGTLIAPYPAGQTDIDGLAVSHDGKAYLVTDEPGFIYVWDFVAGAYATPLNNPWTTSEVFSAGAWIWETVTDPNIDVSPASLSSAQAPNTTTNQTLTVANTGGGTLNWNIAEEPAPRPQQAPDSVVGSSLTAVTPATLTPGSTTNVCFTAHIASPDLEYTDRFDVDLPDGWTIGAVAANSVPAANGCYVPPVSGVAAGNVVYWQSPGTLPTSCGSWNGGSAGMDFNFCVDVTVPDCSGAPWNLPWNIIGDTWGSPPHSVSGAFSSVTCNAPPVCSAPSDVPWLSLAPTSGATAGGGSTPVTVTFDSTSLAPGTYNANLCVTSNDPDPGPGNGTDLVIVPVTLMVQGPTAVTLNTVDAAPLPLAVPLTALPAALGLAAAAVYTLRRRR